MLNRMCNLLLISPLFALVGCAAYAVPGRGADFHAIGISPAQRNQQTDPGIGDVLEKKPLASFPATVALVRIQDSGYQNRTVQTYGNGNYCVVLTHDVEKPAQLAKLAALPMIAGMEPINRLELPDILGSDRELRAAAASIHADMLLVYTFDDNFEDEDIASGLTLVTIGIMPTKSLTVTSTASAVLMDTRNGYIYGAAEATEKKNILTNCWGETTAAEAVRQQVETAVFEKLCGEFGQTWTKVIKQYASAAESKP